MPGAGPFTAPTPDERRTPRVVPRPSPRIALVLGGGGLKGFAHIGVLRALRERGIRPSLIAGSSIGALLGAAFAAGVRPEEMARRAIALRRRELFRLNHYAMLLERMRAQSLYMAEPLRALVESVVPEGDFASFGVPLLVNTVDVARGTQVVWGLAGLRDVPVRDAVYASCALPGFFPPGRVDGRVCVDGGTVDNLPVSIAAQGIAGPPADAIIAVDVGNADLAPQDPVHMQGFASIFMRSASVMMHALQENPLASWQGPPMLLVRPRVSHIGWFAFGHAEALIEEGYRAACTALRDVDALLTAPGGIYPRRAVRVEVDRAACTGCRLCVALAPRTMAIAADGKAFALTHEHWWSPADGDFVKQCPTSAIRVDAMPARPQVSPAVAVTTAPAGAAAVVAVNPVPVALPGALDGLPSLVPLAVPTIPAVPTPAPTLALDAGSPEDLALPPVG